MYHRVSLAVQLGILVAIIFVGYRPPFSLRPENGILSVYVYRTVSESLRYDVFAPNLYLEMEAGGVVHRTNVTQSNRELVVNREFVFHNVNYLSFLMLRSLDVGPFKNLTRSLLVISPAEIENNKTKIYKPDALNWFVLRLHWVKDDRR